MTNNDKPEQLELQLSEVQTIDEQTLYTARIEFRSKGTGMEVYPHFSYSHHFPDSYAGEWPASYLAARDIAMELAQVAQTTYYTSDDDLPSDPDAAAELAIAMTHAQKETKQ